MNLGQRLTENPILTARDVKPSLPELEVVSVFNAAAAKVGDEVILLLRVAERPRTDVRPGSEALTLDFDQSYPTLHPLPSRYREQELVGMCFLDTRQAPPRVVVAYIPADLPGLDLRDRRTIRYRHNGDYERTGNDGYVDFLAQLSHLRVARSRDGVHFTVDDAPAIRPFTDLEEYGVEDPRATLLDGVWYITYVSVSRWGISTSLATTMDFRSFEREGVIFLPDQKDVVLFPQAIGGKYAALTRPMPQSFSRILGIWIAFSDDLIHWGGHKRLALPRSGYWDELRTGASAVPFLTEHGWLELYHGVDRNTTYAMGALLLDPDDPRKVIARSPTPILEPTETYERMGLFNDTVFSCGHIDLGGGLIRMYYGAADSVIAAADFHVDDIVRSLEPWHGAAERLVVV